MAGNINGCKIFNRNNETITIGILPETQCGFCNSRSIIAIVFSLPQTQKKCAQGNMEL